MSNPFKVGDKVLITGEDASTVMATRDCTTGGSYKLLSVGKKVPDGAPRNINNSDDDIYFMDDVGDYVQLKYWGVIPA